MSRNSRLLPAVVLLLLAVAWPVLADLDDAVDALQRALNRLQQTTDFRLPAGGRGRAYWVWNMNPGYYNQVERTFYAGNSYVLVAAGDQRVSDVDIKVYDENWNLIESDTDESSVAVVTFRPKWSGLFHVRTIYYAGQRVGSVGFFVAYR